MSRARDQHEKVDDDQLRARRRTNKAEQAQEELTPDPVLPPDVEAKAVTNPSLALSANLGRKAQVLSSLQRTHGNAYVQRLVEQGERDDAAGLSGKSTSDSANASEDRATAVIAGDNSVQAVSIRDGAGISLELNATMDNGAPQATGETPGELEREIEEEEAEPVQLPPGGRGGLEDGISGEIGVFYTRRKGELDLEDAFGMATYVTAPRTWARERRLPDGSTQYSVRVRLAVRYEWDVDPQGRKHVSGPRDGDVTEDSWNQIVYDLTPTTSAPVRSPRVEYWARDLTERHELFHISDWAGAFRVNQPVGQAWLNAQSASSLEDAISKAGEAVSMVITNVDNYMGSGDSAPCEVRAYDNGADLYRERAQSVEERATREEWEPGMIIEAT